MTMQKRWSSHAPICLGAKGSHVEHNDSVSPSCGSRSKVNVNVDDGEFTYVIVGDDVDDHCVICNLVCPLGDEGEYTISPWVRRGPVEPTREEIEQHNIAHLPFRNWCEHCVKGKAVSHPHVTSKDHVKNAGGLHFDYWFMRDGPGSEKVTVLSMKCDASKGHGGHVVAKKGRSGDLAINIIKDIEKLGHGTSKVIFKSDGENAIGDLMTEVKNRRKGVTLIEQSPRYESKSNGVAERGVRTHEGQVRSMKSALEDRLKMKVPSTHKIMTWMVSHVADMLNKFVVGVDGNSTYERVNEKKYRVRCWSSEAVFGSGGRVYQKGLLM